MLHHSVDAQRYHTSCMTLQDLATGELRHETFTPPAMNEVSSVWLRWQHEDDAMMAARLGNPSETSKRKPTAHASSNGRQERRHTAVGNRLGVGRTSTSPPSPQRASCRSPSLAPPSTQALSLKELLDIQTRRSEEILAEENANKRPTLRHMCLLGKTADIALGGVDGLIARARELTATGRE